MDCIFEGDPDDSLKCSICLEVAKDPKQEEACGKLFCTTCIEQLENDSCPICRTPHARYFMDRRSQREIQALAVLCDNEKNGCDWKGTVATLENHKAQCGYAEVQCPNSCVETSHLLRKDLEYHLNHDCSEREYTCCHCGKVSTYMAITVVHDVLCEKKMVTCSTKGCEVVMERGQVASHVRESCDYTEVYCKYASVGCEEIDLRKNMLEHEENSESHLTVALNKIAKLSEAALSGQSKKESITFKLTEFSKKNKSESSHWFQPFFTRPSGYLMCYYLFPNGDGSGEGTHLSVYLQILHGPHDDRLKWPLKAVFTVELLNQESDSNHYSDKLEFEGDGDHCTPGMCGWGFPEFIALSDLPFPASKTTQYPSAHPISLKGDSRLSVLSSSLVFPPTLSVPMNPPQYLKDDTLYFRVTSKVSSDKSWLNHTHE